MQIHTTNGNKQQQQNRTHFQNKTNKQKTKQTNKKQNKQNKTKNDKKPEKGKSLKTKQKHKNKMIQIEAVFYKKLVDIQKSKSVFKLTEFAHTHTNTHTDVDKYMKSFYLFLMERERVSVVFLRTKISSNNFIQRVSMEHVGTISICHQVSRK